MSSESQELKYCQSCIERGFNPPNMATREWQTGIYYCDDCFNAIIQNMTSVPGPMIPAALEAGKPSNFQNGPVLDFIYEYYHIPPELRFDSVDTVVRNYDKIFNFQAPAVINRSLESIELEIEQLQMAIFHIKYRVEPLTMQIGKLKEARRKEKNLTGMQDSVEKYKKPPKVKEAEKDKLAKKMNLGNGLSMDELIKKAREREFNKMAGNCPECGGSMPCPNHL